MKKIKLTNCNKFTLVDDEDYELVNSYRWRMLNTGYIASGSNGFLLHRLINKTPEGKETDHINRDKLDNRKSNLRTCTRSENVLNREFNQPRRGSITRNTRWGYWQVRVQVNKQRIWLGNFKLKADAKKAIKEFNDKKLYTSSNFAGGGVA